MLLSSGPIEEFSSCCSPPAMDIDLSSSWLFSEFSYDPFYFVESVSEPAPNNNRTCTVGVDFFLIIGVGPGQCLVGVDDNKHGQECNVAACLHIAMEVDGGVVWKVRGTEIEIPRHFRYIYFFILIFRNFI